MLLNYQSYCVVLVFFLYCAVLLIAKVFVGISTWQWFSQRAANSLALQQTVAMAMSNGIPAKNVAVENVASWSAPLVNRRRLREPFVDKSNFGDGSKNNVVDGDSNGQKSNKTNGIATVTVVASNTTSQDPGPVVGMVTQAVNGLKMEYVVTVPSSISASFDSTDQVYSQLQASLASSFASGDFLSALRQNCAANGATILGASTPLAPIAKLASLTQTKSPTESKGANISVIVGLSVGLGIPFLLALCFVTWRHELRKGDLDFQRVRPMPQPLLGVVPTGVDDSQPKGTAAIFGSSHRSRQVQPLPQVGTAPTN